MALSKCNAMLKVLARDIGRLDSQRGILRQFHKQSSGSTSHSQQLAFQRRSVRHVLTAGRTPSLVIIPGGQVRCFRTSPRHCVPPFIWMVAKPFMKLGAIVYGRGVRKWWQGLPKDKRKHFREVIQHSWHKILAASGVVVGLSGFYYVSHLQEVPITKRKRFIAFTPEQFKSITDFEYEQLMESYKGKTLPATHQSYRRIEEVARRIIDANQDLDFMRRTTWGVIVVDADDVNAFVLPNGHMFVMRGILDTVKNDDQLANVLAHEMSHAVLGHGAEQVSLAQLVDMVIIVVMAAIWAVMPSDGIALVTQWFYHKVVDILFNMPYSRKLETEADEVGLELAAKACFDVRESSAFWCMMRANTLMKNQVDIGWLSTHPTHAERAAYLDSIIPHALDLRHSCKCHKLSGPDPRIEMRQFLQAVESQIKERSEIPQDVVTIAPPGGQAVKP